MTKKLWCKTSEYNLNSVTAKLSYECHDVNVLKYECQNAYKYEYAGDDENNAKVDRRVRIRLGV